MQWLIRSKYKLFMRGLFLLLAGLLLSWGSMAQTFDVLAYEPGKRLNWQDFKGRPSYTDRHKGAEITVSIFLKMRPTSFWSGAITYDAYAVAFRDDSWVRADYRDDYTLKHEQLHFDIAHLYAESLEIELNSLDKKEIRKPGMVEALLTKHIQLMQEYQDYYDRDTHGGNYARKQREWERRIRNELRKINLEV